MMHCTNCGDEIFRHDGEDHCDACLEFQGDRKELDKQRRRMRRKAIRNATDRVLHNMDLMSGDPLLAHISRQIYR